MKDNDQARHKEEENGQVINERNTEMIIKMGTWNIRGLNGKEVEICEEFDKAKLDVLTISETKKKGSGIEKLTRHHILIYSGVELEERAAAGVGCILHTKDLNRICKWEKVSDRILILEMEQNNQKKTIISVYGPDENERKEKRINSGKT